MSVRKKMALGAFWVMLEKGGQQVLNLVVFVIVARLIGPAEIGLAGLTAVFSSLALLVVYGLVDAVISQRLTDDRSLSTLFWAVIGAGIALALATFFAAGPFADVLPADLIREQPAQRAFGDGCGLADLCLTRVAVKVGGDDQPGIGQRVVIVKNGPLAA